MCLGLWVAAALLGPERLNVDGQLGTLLAAGLVLAVVNFFLKPVLVILSLPFIIFTLGLFLVVVNGLIVFLASQLYEPLFVASLWWAMVAGIVIGLVNYLVTAILKE